MKTLDKLLFFSTFFFVFALVFLKFQNIKEEEKEVKNIDFIVPYHDIAVDFYTAKKYKLTACLIRKSMSQLLFNTMCLLHDPVKFANHSLNETWRESRPCEYNKGDDFSEFPEDLRTHRDFTRIAFVRDPFERFLSLYLDKCVREKYCWHCEEDMRCVVKNIHQSLVERSKIFDYRIVPNFMDIHAAPLTWFCDFKHYLRKFHVMVMGVDVTQRKQSMLEMYKILKGKNVPKKIISKIVRETIGSDTSHSTYTSSRREEAMQQIKTDPIVREYLHKIYLYDYLVFPFDRSHLDQQYQDLKWDEKFKNEFSDILKIQEDFATKLS